MKPSGGQLHELRCDRLSVKGCAHGPVAGHLALRDRGPNHWKSSLRRERSSRTPEYQEPVLRDSIRCAAGNKKLNTFGVISRWDVFPIDFDDQVAQRRDAERRSRRARSNAVVAKRNT